MGKRKQRRILQQNAIDLVARDPELRPHERLALAVVVMAAREYELAKKNPSVVFRSWDKDWIDRDELEKFFRSRWCGVLLGTTGLSGDQIISISDERSQTYV